MNYTRIRIARLIKARARQRKRRAQQQQAAWLAQCMSVFGQPTRQDSQDNETRH